MYLTAEKKAELFAKFGKSAQDTGSTEGQIALFTFRINHLTEHLKQNRKDFGTERALTNLVGKRRRLLDYLPEPQKEVVLLRFYDDLSFKEIAEKTGVSINTALGRMRYALINLRKLIGEKQLSLVG